MKENEMESYAEYRQRILEQLMVPKKLLGPYGSRASAVETRRLYFKRFGIEDNRPERVGPSEVHDRLVELGVI